MNLRCLRDEELLNGIREQVAAERQLLTKILHYLREVERRRAHCDVGCGTLFDFAVKDLKYSESQAARRIQAMRLIKELPEIERKIEEGALNLSNISQAQAFFRSEANGTSQQPPKPASAQRKREVLQLLENKSSRDGQKALIEIGGAIAHPRERERVLSDDKSEVRFVLDQDLRQKFDDIRSYLGARAHGLSFADFLRAAADALLSLLSVKKFGRRGAARIASHVAMSSPSDHHKNKVAMVTATVASTRKDVSLNPRYIASEVREKVWLRDKGACTSCGQRSILNFDHIVPIARGGQSNVENLRLLCFACNQRHGIRSGLIALRD
jgi:5-methylcytosine-specific restriction endonuclease McrA